MRFAVVDLVGVVLNSSSADAARSPWPQRAISPLFSNERCARVASVAVLDGVTMAALKLGVLSALQVVSGRRELLRRCRSLLSRNKQILHCSLVLACIARATASSSSQTWSFSFFSLHSLASSPFGPSRSRRLACNTAVVNRPSPPSMTCCAARSQRRRVCCAARTLPRRVGHVRSSPQRRRAPRSTGHRAVPPRNAPAQRFRSHSRLDQAQAAAADVARLASRRTRLLGSLSMPCLHIIAAAALSSTQQTHDALGGALRGGTWPTARRPHGNSINISSFSPRCHTRQHNRSIVNFDLSCSRRTSTCQTTKLFLM